MWYSDSVYQSITLSITYLYHQYSMPRSKEILDAFDLLVALKAR